MSSANNQRIPELDGIRGLAILLVIVWHYGNNQIVANDFSFLHWVRISTSFFWSGVDLFFVLSGFLLGGILLKNRGSGSYFKTFYIRRACRIFPLYYGFFLVFVILYHTPARENFPWLFGSPPEPLPLWTYATYTQNIFMGINETLGAHGLVATWSLAVEEQFYLVLPLVIFFLRGRLLLALCIAMVIAAPFLRYYCSNWYESFAMLHCRADSLLIGVLAAYAMQHERTVNLLRSWRMLLYLVFFALLALVGIMSFYYSFMSINYVLLNSIVAVMYALLILLALLQPKDIVPRILRSTWLVQVGIISYGIYIYHLFISGILHQLFFGKPPILSNAADLSVTLLSFIVTLAVAWCSYNFFEKKLIAIGHRYKY